MPVMSNVLVQDPVDAHELSAAAAEAVGLPPPADGWHLYDLGAVNTLQADEEPDAAVAVSVQFSAAGGGLPSGEDEQRPEGYALVCFVTTGGDPAADRHHHQGLAAALGPWLHRRSLRWSCRVVSVLDRHPPLPALHPAPAPAVPVPPPDGQPGS